MLQGVHSFLQEVKMKEVGCKVCVESILSWVSKESL
jgi:hypothetical protein